MNKWMPWGKWILLGLYKYSGAARAEEARLWRAGQGFMSILLFHRVTDAIPADGLTIGTARFRAICEMLRRNFRVVPLGQVFKNLRSGRPLLRRTVAITFDDCYRDNLFAARVLKEYGLPACFFLPTAYVGTDHVFPWDRHLPRFPNLSWDDVREMAAMGFEIGSHTATHPDLGTIALARAMEEIFAPKATLERELGRPVRWFAYPFGGPDNFRPEWVPMLREAGYEGCVSAHGNFVRAGCDDYALPRKAVPRFESVLHLELYLTGSLEWFHRRKNSTGPFAEDAVSEAMSAEQNGILKCARRQ
jgi:peptidoglycan/xylan/chitin deacetylase (PgdA/CDA1 family)